MVKLGPKLSPLSRRELENLEKQQKRVAQLENGIDPSVSGEPKENLNFLLSQSRRTRSRRLGYPALEQARRKWEKNRQRTQARRLAKKNTTTSVEQCHTNWSDLFEKITENGTVISDGEEIMQNLFAGSSLISLRLGETLGNILAGNVHDRTTEDHAHNESSRLGFNTPAAPPPLLPFLYAGSDLVPEPSSVTAPHMGIEIVTTHFSANESLLRLSSSDLKDYDAVGAEPTPNSSVQVTPTANKQIPNPDKTHALLPSSIGAVDSMIRKSRSVRFGTLSTDSPGVCTRKGSNRSFVFSEPLDPAKYGAKTWLDSSFDSLEEYRTLSRAKSSVQKATEPYTTYNFLGSCLSSASMLSASSNTVTGLQGPVNTTRGDLSDVHGLGVLPDCKNAVVPFRRRDTHEWISDSQFTTEYLADIALDGPFNSADVFPTDSHSQSPSDPTDTDLFGIIARPRMPNTRPARIIYPRPALEQTKLIGTPEPIGREISRNILPVTPQQKATSYISHLSSPIDDGLFSSNRRIFGKGDSNADIKNSQGPSHSFDSDRTPSSPSILRTLSKSVSNVVHTLAPAASITQVKKMRKPRIDDADKMEKGSLTRSISHPKPQPHGSLDDEMAFNPLTHTEGAQQLGNTLNYPDTPLMSRPGIAAPASTPATRSPLKFGMILPSPPWSRAPVLPTHTGNAASADSAGFSRGFVSALKWMLKKTFGYFWQRRQ